MNQITNQEELRKAVIKAKCEASHLFFTRYFFKIREGIKFIVNWHHVLVCDEIEQVIRGETENLIVNVSPGSSKTEVFVINFIARGICINPRARFMHLSYSDDLAVLNSEKAREIVASDEYQELWEIPISSDSNSKKRWNVVSDGTRMGGAYASAAGGQVTGFRAGHMAEGFQGAIIIDDPLKVEDAYSKTARDKANRKLLSTVKSRKANPKTPIIVIMQRLAEEDPSGFILAGKFPGKWKHVQIPAIITDEYVSKLPERIRNMVDSEERDQDGRFSYWPYKEPIQDLVAMEKADSYVFAGQYMQRPAPLGGGLIKGAWFNRYSVLPPLKWRAIYGDTAQKTKEHNDYSVFQCWGAGEDGRIYLIDQIRGKWEAPELKTRCIDFWNKHLALDHSVLPIGSLRSMNIEDKASGTGLIQEIRIAGRIPVNPIERVKDKYTRVVDIVGYIESGYVHLPDNQGFVDDFVRECELFTPDDTHQHDDQIDPMCDAITQMLAQNNSVHLWAALAD